MTQMPTYHDRYRLSASKLTKSEPADSAISHDILISNTNMRHSDLPSDGRRVARSDEGVADGCASLSGGSAAGTNDAAGTQYIEGINTEEDDTDTEGASSDDSRELSEDTGDPEVDESSEAKVELRDCYVAAASPSSQTLSEGPDEEVSSEQPETTRDALVYLDRVKRHCASRPGSFVQFQNVLAVFRTSNRSIATTAIQDVTDEICTLFAGNSELIHGFNRFLPPGHRIHGSGRRAKQNHSSSDPGLDPMMAGTSPGRMLPRSQSGMVSSRASRSDRLNARSRSIDDQNTSCYESAGLIVGDDHSERSIRSRSARKRADPVKSTGRPLKRAKACGPSLLQQIEERIDSREVKVAALDAYMLSLRAQIADKKTQRAELPQTREDWESLRTRCEGGERTAELRELELTRLELEVEDVQHGWRMAKREPSVEL